MSRIISCGGYIAVIAAEYTQIFNPEMDSITLYHTNHSVVSKLLKAQSNAWCCLVFCCMVELFLTIMLIGG